MKKFLLFMLMAVSGIQAMAQRNITGKVLESDSQEPVAQTTVRLLKKDSTMVTGSLTDLNGYFRVKAPAAGSYIVQITCVGFKPFTKTIKVSADKDIALGTIDLSPDAIMLKGATVTGQASKVTLKEDTFVYNASAYRTPEGSVIEELVRKLPGAQVDDAGKVTINGKEVKKILIDGKEFMTGDTKTAMKNLPTSIVERVRAYDQKSDLARVSGIDDGEEETVLDFGIKRGMNKGYMVNADLAAGTRHRYSGRIFAGMQSSDLKIFVPLSANNVNDMGFPGGGGGRFGGGRQGLTATKMAGFNLNYEKKDRLKFDASIRWNHSDGDAVVRTSSENFMTGSSSTFKNSLRSNLSRSNSWDARFRLEWTPDSLTNIMMRPQFNYNSSDGLSEGISLTMDADPYRWVKDPLDDSALGTLVDEDVVINRDRSNSITYSDSKSMGGWLQLNRRLNNSGRNVTLRFSGNVGDGMDKSFSNSLVEYFQLVNQHGEDSTHQTNRYAVTPTKNWNYGIRATYSEPIFRQTYLQFSYQYQYSYRKSDRATYDFSNIFTQKYIDFFGIEPQYRGWDDYLRQVGYPYDSYKDDKLSRFSEYRNYNHTAEIMLRIVRKAYNLNVGFQVLPQRSHFTQDYQGVHTDTVRTVTNFAPTADFRWKISKVSQLRFTYRANSSQPSMSDLLDITDDSDPLNIRKGNPGLKPSFTQNFRLFYNNYIQNHQRSIMAHVNFSTTRNSISNMVTYNEQSGGSTIRPENINGNWNTFGMFMFNTAIDSAGYFNVNTFTTLRYNNNVGYVSVSRNEDSQKSTTRTTTIGERLAGSYRNDWLEVELNGSLEYMHARSELQSNNNLDTWTFSYGGSLQLTAPWGTQLSTSMNMNSRRGYNDASMNTNELIWNAQVSQSFLRGNALTLSLQMYDILHQQSTFSRTVDAMRRSDTEYNAITNYAMLHVIYRLNIFGGKNGGPRGPEGGPGGRRGGGFGGPGGRPGGGGGFGRPRF
ncbi:MAG: TonB-dependent receptor [Prevotella sp.]|nr:TonB-dependent receptor [Prevotella sp.]